MASKQRRGPFLRAPGGTATGAWKTSKHKSLWAAEEHTFTQLFGIYSHFVKKSGTSGAAAGWTPSTLCTWRTRLADRSSTVRRIRQNHQSVSEPLRLWQDGAFLVRNSSTNTSGEPLVLAIYSEKKVYNIKIRFIGESNKYALGTGLRSNDVSAGAVLWRTLWKKKTSLTSVLRCLTRWRTWSGSTPSFPSYWWVGGRFPGAGTLKAACSRVL